MSRPEAKTFPLHRRFFLFFSSLLSKKRKKKKEKIAQNCTKMKKKWYTTRCQGQPLSSKMKLNMNIILLYTTPILRLMRRIFFLSQFQTKKTSQKNLASAEKKKKIIYFPFFQMQFKKRKGVDLRRHFSLRLIFFMAITWYLLSLP